MEKLETLCMRHTETCASLAFLSDALEALHEIQDGDAKKYKLIRSAVIHNFEIAFSVFCRFLKVYLECEHSIFVESLAPKKIFVRMRDVGALSEDQFLLLLQMLDDRYYASLIFQDRAAQDISDRIAGYHEILYIILHQNIKID